MDEDIDTRMPLIAPPSYVYRRDHGAGGARLEAIRRAALRLAEAHEPVMVPAQIAVDIGWLLDQLERAQADKNDLGRALNILISSATDADQRNIFGRRLLVVSALTMKNCRNVMARIFGTDD